MNLSKSKYCNGLMCKKLLWLYENKPEYIEDIDNDTFETGTSVDIIARDLFGEHICIEFNDLNKMINDTKKALEKENIVVAEASFEYNNNFCSVDILKKSKNNYEIYEVKSSVEIKDIYIDDISYQYYVLNNLGLNIKKCSIVYINSDYVRKGKLELSKLFNIEDVTHKVLLKQKEVENNIKEINKYMETKEERDEPLGIKCKKPYECPFFNYCIKDLDKPNIFSVRRLADKKKFDIYNKGIYKYKDLLNEDIDSMCKEQIEFELYNKEEKIDKDKINEFLNTLSYPLYFLDFETYQQAIPEFDNVKPYMQIPFQYSLHYIKNNNSKLEHTEFIGDGKTDPRRSLALQLVKDIPIGVCTLAYNMRFERMVIKNLANIYPDLKEHLMNIHDNMKDLMVPFKDRHYYTKEMYGSYSIKYVLPALFPDDPSLNYHSLDMVHNGKEAMSSYKKLSELEKEEHDILKNNMLKYCELDTYAMVKIWEKLKEI